MNKVTHFENAKGNIGTGALTPAPTTKSLRDHPARSVYEIDPLLDPRWSRFVERHQNASVFHSVEWLQALRSTYGYEPFVVTTESAGEELQNAIVLCRIKSWLTGSRFVGLPFSDHCEPLLQEAHNLGFLVNHLTAHLSSRKWRYLEIRPLSVTPEENSCLSVNSSYYLHRMDLRKSAGELFKAFHKDCVQRKVRRAEKESLVYEEGNSDLLVDKFYKLLMLTRRRHLLPPQPKSWFRSLARHFGNNMKIRLASKDGIPVASILTLSHKRSMIYKYGGSDAKFNKLGGTPFLFWKTVQDAKENGFEDFDLGRSDLHNEGLIGFKEHLGAERQPLSYWRYPNGVPEGQAKWQFKVAKLVIPLAPEASLSAVGSIFYKHMG